MMRNWKCVCWYVLFKYGYYSVDFAIFKWCSMISIYCLFHLLLHFGTIHTLKWNDVRSSLIFFFSRVLKNITTHREKEREREWEMNPENQYGFISFHRATMPNTYSHISRYSTIDDDIWFEMFWFNFNTKNHSILKCLVMVMAYVCMLRKRLHDHYFDMFELFAISFFFQIDFISYKERYFKSYFNITRKFKMKKKTLSFNSWHFCG